ncbi:uncharacterized protein M437DRAFT_48978 [Aureobasidium melanogenum CBS 110374]|uniref:Small EDRK-rich factor-like N-terminal domain-containing protein n=1 Tax=Aureobasidium melanogenum (strain CBS 110374) TaxID=1043003 RepID=A0A074VYW5_AURM1|nr:uncharacterized protein M437DRAFT_48978 [Aureobasidium melanogenum CBS 110374]KEQ62917.1 hypothetical protein M437DRAFT_48978 [Aureobasidium melanogenum CBS 110374]
MARGNQKERAREKNLKAQGNIKNKTTMSGSEQAKAKENAAEIMRAKQAAGSSSCLHLCRL